MLVANGLLILQATMLSVSFLPKLGQSREGI